ncbi:HK97 family phage prohead protease [Paenibacillus sp. MCAF9]|uniref:HK97 family phage prohead protease n=1 Tax=Paenibacillus sp. MCAF9 TaxID=3233046 RepID=UPI003F9508E1
MIKINNIPNIEHRSFSLQTRSAANGEMYVEGYAALFNSTTTLYEVDGVAVKERIGYGAFTGADITDVIFNYNHGGKVMARTRNNTLQLKVDSKGLLIRARLDGTEEGRKLYEEIKGGYIDRMSFRFTVAHDYWDTDKTRLITKFKKIYDVSAVDIPAYDDTSISVEKTLDEQKRELLAKLDKAIEFENKRKQFIREIDVMLQRRV